MASRPRLAPLVLLLLLVAPALPASLAAGAGHHPDTVTALPWYTGYRYDYRDAGGHVIRYVVSGEGPEPPFLGNGTALSLLRYSQDGKRTEVDTAYLDPGSRVVLGRSRVVVTSDQEARTWIRYDPPADLYGFPLSPGKAWTVNVTQHERWNITTFSDPKHPDTGQASQPFRARISVGNWTTVPTPAGNVSALPVSTVPLDQVSRSEGLVITRYVAPSLRFFARIDEDQTGHHPWRRYELRSYVDNVPPLAAITVGSPNVYEGVPVNLSAGVTHDLDDGIQSIRWDLGDGNTSTAWSLEHAYRHAGTYDVTLTVTDRRNLTSVAHRVLRVRDRPPVPVVDAPQHVDLGVPFNVSGNRSHDPDGTVVNWTWSFGDGATAYGPNATHTYTRAGAYPVRLTVVDDAGSRSHAVVTVLAGNATFDPTPVKVTWLHPDDGSRVWGRTLLGWNVTGRPSLVFLTVDGDTVWDGPPTNATLPWNATAAGRGDHRLVVAALDARGGVHRAAIDVTVAPPPAPTPPPSNSSGNVSGPPPAAVDHHGPGFPTLPVPLPGWAPLVALLAAVLLARPARHKV